MEIGFKEKDMVKANILILMEVCIKVIGLRIICMEKESINTPMQIYTAKELAGMKS